MADVDWLIPLGVGGLFILLGLAAILWGRREEKSYDYSLSTRADLREFMEHWPPRPQPGSLKVGGWIAVAVGLVVLVLGGVLALLA